MSVLCLWPVGGFAHSKRRPVEFGDCAVDAAHEALVGVLSRTYAALAAAAFFKAISHSRGCALTRFVTSASLTMGLILCK